jgi:Tol biopolymer transport system component/imidazolonepropionase-like amidohydrolase
MYLRLFTALILAAFTVLPALAQSRDAAKWDVNAPFGQNNEVAFTTDEGTWMSLDVSPDGREIVFDLLGDIYIMPASGGRATLLSGGAAWDAQPRFSPDGREISFTSDRAGGDNIWVMNRDGSGARQVSSEDFRLLNNAVWTPDGAYLIARKHFTSTRSLGAGEMWMYHASGQGNGLQLTTRRNDQQDAGEPAVSPDGRYLYWSEDMTPGPTFEYNKDPNAQIYVIRRLDLENGRVSNVITGAGGAVRPQPSPDGRHLAFVRRVRTKSVLYLADLETGEQWPIYDGMSHDQQETWATFGVYPNFNWTPDSRKIIFSADGKIQRLDIESRQPRVIPFEADVRKTVHQAPRFTQDVAPAQFESRMIRDAVTSPDGRWLVFNAAGRIYKKQLPDGTPRRLTDGDINEFYPAVSPDGQWVAYATFDDEELGALYRMRLDGRGQPQKLTGRRGYYVSPSFSPDGSRIVFLRTGGNALLGSAHGLEAGIYTMPAAGGEMTLVREGGSEPRFDHTGRRIYFMIGGGLNKTYRSVDLGGNDERTHFNLRHTNSVVPSPDGRWVAFTELFNAYVAPFPATGGAIDLSGTMRTLPVARVTRDAGSYLHWSGDSQRLNWTIGPEFFSRDLNHSFSFLAGAPEELPHPDTTGIRIGLHLPTDTPAGRVAFTNARIITMNGDEVIENGTIVIDRNRISAVGSTGDVQIPRDAHVVDAAGKTIMPGMVDVHAHYGMSWNGLSPQQSWPYLSNLAFGVTTLHNPSAGTAMVFSEAEMVRAGRMVGPRLYSTGTILYGAEGDFKAVINSLEDARSHLRRMQAVGAFSVKSYNQPRRDQRQQVLQAAHELGMMVVPEGGSFFQHNMNMIVDGHTGIEHAVPVVPLHRDVLQLWGATEVGYTPTLVVGYGGLWGENHFYQTTNVWENERLLAFNPRQTIDARSRRRVMVPEDEFHHIRLAEAAKALTDHGVRVNLGAHGQLQGLAAHWELWSFVQGGMTELEALRAATLNGAWYLGLDRDIGSLQQGKLADLVVLDANPLEDIRNSEAIRYVMVNGRLFDAMTMNEVGNHPSERAPFFWERERASDAWVWDPADLTHGQGHSCATHQH